jgi:hypothetical protein
MDRDRKVRFVHPLMHQPLATYGMMREKSAFLGELSPVEGYTRSYRTLSVENDAWNIGDNRRKKKERNRKKTLRGLYYYCFKQGRLSLANTVAFKLSAKGIFIDTQFAGSSHPAPVILDQGPADRLLFNLLE